MRYVVFLFAIITATSTAMFADEEKLPFGLPDGIHATLEVSPEVPKLGEPFYVRLTLENKTDDAIIITEGSLNHWYPYIGDTGNSKHFVIGLKTSVLIPHWPTGYAYSDSEDYEFIVLDPRLVHRAGFSSLLASGEKRIQYLEEHILDRDLESRQETWKSFITYKNITLHYASLWMPFDKDRPISKDKNHPYGYYFFSNTDKFNYHVSMPIRFSNDSVEELLKIEQQKNLITRLKFPIGSSILSDMYYPFLPYDQKRIALTDREYLEKLYPPGTAKSKEHVLNFWERIQIRGSTDEDINGLVQYLWTLPEIERQYFTTRMLSLISEKSAKMAFRSLKFFFEILRMSPEEFHILSQGNISNSIAFKQYQLFHKMTLEELEKEFEKHLTLPIPDDVGKGNKIRGYIHKK